jgi:hypothetical protein
MKNFKTEEERLGLILAIIIGLTMVATIMTIISYLIIVDDITGF